MSIYNNTINVSEDYHYLVSSAEVFYEEDEIPDSIFIYDNNTWTEIAPNNGSFDSLYSDIQEIIIENPISPTLLDTNEDFYELNPAPNNGTFSKRVVVAHKKIDAIIEGYEIIFAPYNLITEITTSTITPSSGYYLQTVDSNNTAVFSALAPRNDYTIFVRTGTDVISLNIENETEPTLLTVNNNLPLKIIIDEENKIKIKELQKPNAVYYGTNTLNLNHFPDFNNNVHYFATIIANDFIACLPVKSLLFVNGTITDVDSYTESDSAYLSAKIINTEVDKVIGNIMDYILD